MRNRTKSRHGLLVGVVFVVLVMCTSGQAVADLVYTHEVELNRWIRPGDPAVWVHQFDHSVTSPVAATLTITAQDVAPREAQVWLLDSNGHWHYLGHLEASLEGISTTVVARRRAGRGQDPVALRRRQPRGLVG